MKKIVFMALVAVLMVSMSLVAQDNKGKRQGPPDGRKWTAKERVDNMEKQLNLTADEKAKVMALFEQQDAKRAEQMAARKAKRDEQRKDRDKKHEEMKVLHEKAVAESDAQLEAIIGKEKMAQWKQYRNEHRKEMRPKREGTPRRN